MSNSGGKSVITRRQALRRAAVIGGAVWAAPVISSFSQTALATHGSTDFCSDGNEPKPGELTFKYVGFDHDCASDGAPPQPPKCNDCNGTGAPFGSPVTIHAVWGKKENPVVTFTGVNYDTTFTIGDGQKMNPNLILVICDGPSCTPPEDRDDFECKSEWLHVIQIHTSCSQDLVIGDIYGAFQLVHGLAAIA